MAVMLITLACLRVLFCQKTYKCHSCFLGGKNIQLHWSLITSFVQGLLTSGYIILLSRVGERVAADMRKTLFASLLRYKNPSVLEQKNAWYSKSTGCQRGCCHLYVNGPLLSSWMDYVCSHCFISFCLRQDVAFYDANKTGQLVNRLTADIQEFKSSFKLVISQV